MKKSLSLITVTGGLVAASLASTDAFAGCTYQFRIYNTSEETFDTKGLRNCKNYDSQCKSKGFNRELPARTSRDFSENILRKSDTRVRMMVVAKDRKLFTDRVFLATSAASCDESRQRMQGGNPVQINVE